MHWIMPGDAVRVWITPLGAPKPTMPVSRISSKRSGAFPAFFPESVADTEQGGQDTMPFHAVRAGHTTGIFLNRSEMITQTQGYEGAEFKTFATLPEAARYMSDGDAGVSERDLMSAGSRARHPPSKSSMPILYGEEGGAPGTSDDAVSTTMDVLFDCIMDPATKTGYIAVWYYAGSLASTKISAVSQVPDARNCARCELIAAKIAIEGVRAQPGFHPTITTVRVYSSSTYATNAVNDYARRAGVRAGHNIDVMVLLADLLKGMKVRGCWTSSADDRLCQVRKEAIGAREDAERGPV